MSLILLSQAGGGEVTTLEEINLTEHVDELIESYGSSSPKVIFSYRVVGNTTGSYTVSISISPLSSNGKTIATQHGLVNKNEIFQSSSASTITNSNGRFSIEQGEAGVLTPDQSDGGNTELTYTWTVNGPDADTIPVWIARGAVTMGIDPVTYEDAPFGTYTSQVTVKLTTP